MGTIKINNITYGSNNSAEIIYKDITVEEKLNSIPIFDPSDNANIENNAYDYLTYAHIVDDLNNSASDKALSANQGKMLKSSIEACNNSINTLENNLTNAIADVRTDTENFIINDLINIIYPIGSIYMSVNNVSPASFLGGTWEAIKDRFLLSAGSSYSAGSTGGAATHTLTIAQMPKHGHGVFVWDEAGTLGNAWCYNGATQQTHNGARIYAANASRWVASGGDAQVAGSGRGDPSGGTSQIGSNAAHNNMPPYLTVYMWKRVS